VVDKPVIYSELQEHYKKLPKKIRICVGEKCLSGKEIAEHIKKRDEIGKLIIRLHKLYEKFENQSKEKTGRIAKEGIKGL